MDTNTAVLISSGQVLRRYGDRSHMWIERRLEDGSGFPKPVYIGRLRFWRLADLEKWEHSLASTFPKGGGRPPKRVAKPAAVADDEGGALAGR
jgi:hypothetical protein